jgi:hypothetical protein
MCVFQPLVFVPDLIPPQRFPRHQFSSGFHEQVLSFAVLICFRVAHPSLPPGFVFLNAEFFSRSLYFCFAAAGVRRLSLFDRVFGSSCSAMFSSHWSCMQASIHPPSPNHFPLTKPMGAARFPSANFSLPRSQFSSHAGPSARFACC